MPEHREQDEFEAKLDALAAESSPSEPLRRHDQPAEAGSVGDEGGDPPRSDKQRGQAEALRDKLIRN